MEKAVKVDFRKRYRTFLLLLFFVFTFFNAKGQESSQMVMVTFGNSTTAPRKNIEKVYAVRIAEDLKEKRIDIKVINAGTPSSHSGSIKDNDFAKVDHGRDRFDTAVLRHNPDWVTINFGLNDSWQDKGANGLSRIPLKAYRQNLAFYIDQIRKNKGQAILMTPNPVGKQYFGYHKKRLKQYRRIVRALSKEKNVELVDSWKLFQRYVRKNHTKIDSLLLDGIHPGDMGHNLIAKEIEKIITSAQNKHPAFQEN
ncbi:MAG: SGNH/GDSL hydrolase family protein [Sphingobacteriaceae bacterium]